MVQKINGYPKMRRQEFTADTWRVIGLVPALHQMRKLRRDLRPFENAATYSRHSAWYGMENSGVSLLRHERRPYKGHPSPDHLPSFTQDRLDRKLRRIDLPNLYFYSPFSFYFLRPSAAAITMREPTTARRALFRRGFNFLSIRSIGKHDTHSTSISISTEPLS